MKSFKGSERVGFLKLKPEGGNKSSHFAIANRISTIAKPLRQTKTLTDLKSKKTRTIDCRNRNIIC
jgi:hypothetical protein